MTEENLPLYVSLDALMFGDTNQYTKLVKRIDETFFNKKINDLFDYLVDEKTDNLNPDGFDKKEKKVAQYVAHVLENEPHQLMAFSNQHPPQEIYLEPQGKMINYLDKIVQKEKTQISSEFRFNDEDWTISDFFLTPKDSKPDKITLKKANDKYYLLSFNLSDNLIKRRRDIAQFKDQQLNFVLSTKFDNNLKSYNKIELCLNTGSHGYSRKHQGCI